MFSYNRSWLNKFLFHMHRYNHDTFQNFAIFNILSKIFIYIYIDTLSVLIDLFRFAEAMVAKRRKLDPSASKEVQMQTLRQIPSLRLSQCRDVLHLLRDDGAGQRSCSSATVAHPVASRCLTTLRVLGHDGTDIPAPVMSLPALVQAKVSTCPLYRSLLYRTLQAHRNTLSLVYYSDECTGGNVLSATVPKKAALTYVQWLQWPILFKEAMWLTLSVFRHKDMQRCRYGFASVVRSILEYIREETRHGFTIDFGTEFPAQVIQVDQVLLLGDHENHRSTLGCKGASGFKCCLKCVNCLSIGKAEHVRGHIDVACPDVSSFTLQNDETVHATAVLLREQPNKSKREEAEKMLGWVWEALEHGPLMSPLLSRWLSITGVIYDPMHDLWSNGLIGQELSLWRDCLTNNLGTTLEQLRGYASLWRPVRNSFAQSLGNPEALFQEKLWKCGQDYRGDAKGCDLALTLAVAYGEEIVRARTGNSIVLAALDSLRALKLVCMKVQSLKKDPAGAEALRALQQYHVNLHVAAYGKDHVRPKLHFSLHIPEQVLRFRKLLDCFCCERKNSAFKNLMQTKGFVRDFNKSVLLELVSHDLHEVHEAESWGPRLLGSKLPEISIGAQSAVVSATLEFKCIRYCRGQFLILEQDRALEIACGAQIGDAHFLLVEVLLPCAPHKPYSVLTHWTRSAAHNGFVALNLQDAEKCQAPLYHRVADDGSVWLLL